MSGYAALAADTTIPSPQQSASRSVARPSYGALHHVLTREVSCKTNPGSARRTASSAVGPAWNAAHTARRPALRQRLSVRRDLPGARRGSGAGAALCRYREQLHLDEISYNVAQGAHAILLLDRAGWHTTGKLDVPKNITPIFLPSRAPELNPVENVWQYLRHNWISNTVFENYDAIVDAACDAWRKLTAKPETITSIGMRDWAHVGQPL